MKVHITASEGQWIIYCNLMQGALSHINVIHQGSNSPLAQQQQLHSLHASVHAPSARIHGAVIWLGANLEPRQPVTDQYLIGLGSSLLFSVLRHILWFSPQLPHLRWLTLLPEIKTPALIRFHWGDLPGARPSLAQSWPVTEEQYHSSLTCQDRWSEDGGDAGRRKRRLRLGRYQFYSTF